MCRGRKYLYLRSRLHRSRSSRCRGTLDSAVRYTRPSVELISTLGLVQRTAQSSRSSRCRATLDNGSVATYSAVESVFTMSSYTRQCFCCNVQRCRVGLHDVELHSTMVLLQRTVLSSRSSRHRATLDSGSGATYSAVESDFTMSRYTRQWIWCNVQRCRVDLRDVEIHYSLVSSSYRHWVWCKSVFTMSHYTRRWFWSNVKRSRVGLHDVELHSTMVLVQRTALSSRSSQCRGTLDSAVRCTRPDVELRSTYYSTTFYAISPEILSSSGWPLKSENRNFLQN